MSNNSIGDRLRQLKKRGMFYHTELCKNCTLDGFTYHEGEQEIELTLKSGFGFDEDLKRVVFHEKYLDEELKKIANPKKLSGENLSMNDNGEVVNKDTFADDEQPVENLPEKPMIRMTKEASEKAAEKVRPEVLDKLVDEVVEKKSKGDLNSEKDADKLIDTANENLEKQINMISQKTEDETEETTEYQIKNNTSDQTEENSIQSLTDILFDTIRKLQNNEIEVAQAKAIGGLSQTLINTAKVQIEYNKATKKPARDVIMLKGR